MAQRTIEPLLIADDLELVKRDHMEAATHPASELGTDISPAEWARIQRADAALKRLYRYGEGLVFFISGIRGGMDAPGVQRNGRELFGRDGCPEYESEGMRN